MTYRDYGYPWRWAIPAEFFWRVEHVPVFGPLARWGYRMRKACEHRGSAARVESCGACGSRPAWNQGWVDDGEPMPTCRTCGAPPAARREGTQ